MTSDSPRISSAGRTALQTADWRRSTFALYAEVRELALRDPAVAHAHWVAVRDALFLSHVASALLPEQREGFTGLPVPEYQPQWRFTAEIEEAGREERLEVPTGTDGVVPFELAGVIRFPEGTPAAGGTLDVWRLRSYGGGLFVPMKDPSADTYGGGRYLIDTIKGADLGGDPAAGSLIVDLNFAYNPSCAYDPAWACPLAPAGNTLRTAVPVGERYPA